MKKKICGIGIVSLLTAIMVYIYGVAFFQSHFLFHATINGIKVACMTEEQTKNELNKIIDEYEIQIIGREDLNFMIKGDEIDLKANWGNSIQELIVGQNEYTWFLSLFSKNEYEKQSEITINEGLLKEILNHQKKLMKEEMRAPQNARIGEYIEKEYRYELIAPDQGTYVLKGKMFPYIRDAILELKASINISDLECYVKPTIDENDIRLKSVFEQMNQMVSTRIMYQFGENCEQLDGDIIHQWIKRDGYFVSVDEKEVYEYVKQLSKKYDTAYRKHLFKTVKGEEITISQGHYGWWMNRKEESNEIIELIKQGANTDRKAIYFQEAACFDEPDYGNTYLEIDLSNQHLYFIKEGNVYLETDFVSGNISNGSATPEGIYPITYKERNKTLRGADYASDVSYWMPFNGGIGLHDASWRKAFGGDIYKTNGSHGCINLPVDMAEKIYAEVYTGMPVICYYITGDVQDQ